MNIKTLGATREEGRARAPFLSHSSEPESGRLFSLAAMGAQRRARDVGAEEGRRGALIRRQRRLDQSRATTHPNSEGKKKRRQNRALSFARSPPGARATRVAFVQTLEEGAAAGGRGGRRSRGEGGKREDEEEKKKKKRESEERTVKWWALFLFFRKAPGKISLALSEETACS